MIPVVKTLTAKKLIGQRINTSFSENRTVELWRNFMPRRKEIQYTVNADLISMQVYHDFPDFSIYNPALAFDKWAAVEVSSFDHIPEGMETFTIPGGLYAVFVHKGGPGNAAETFGYIFGSWLPASDFEADHRPHFEILGEKYKNNDPDSEEEIWIPIKPKRS
ncbi:MAG: GyrI-like domain-containing protein [Bacteroidales bacterium]